MAHSILEINDERIRSVEDALGARLTNFEPRAHGLHSTIVARAGARRVFVKWNDRRFDRQFEAEARGLDALRAGEPEIAVPEVLGYSDAGPGRSFLALSYLEPGVPRGDFDELLGRGLAKIHRVTSESGFGFEIDGTCGATLQRNGFLPSWVEFFRERRLGHQIEFARERGMAKEHVALLESLADRIHRLIDDEARPSLIHGDLWRGNVIVAPDGRPALVDPAPYFADREMEFGMMRLFGGFSSRVYDAYRESWPLRGDARYRIEAYSLYHVLNHFALFGGRYGLEAVAMARRILSR